MAAAPGTGAAPTARVPGARGRRPDPPVAPALARCCRVPPADFARDHWSRAPLLSRAAELPSSFADLLSAGAIDEMVTSRALRMPFFRMVRDGDTVPAADLTRSVTAGSRRVGDLADADRVREHFAGGATLVLQSLHRSHPPLIRYCRQLAADLGHPTQCNAYVTPPGSQGFAAHHDTHDVFVLQVDGHKRWHVHPPAFELPLADQSGRGRDGNGRLEPSGEPMLSVELGPGDALYLPRGYVHSAGTAGERSIHLTIGVLVHRWHDLLRDVVALAGEDVEFRRALPIGSADDLPDLAGFLRRVAAWVEGVDPQDLAPLVRDRLSRGMPAEPVGPLAAQLALAGFDASTTVRARTGLRYTLDTDGDRVVLTLPDRELSLPGAVAGALRAALSGRPLSASDLVRDGGTALDEAGAVVLLRRLLREGAVAPGS